LEPVLKRALAAVGAFWDARIGAAERKFAALAAARALGVPHRTAWQRIQQMESSLGVRLLETTAGGAGGGGSSLSPAARDFIQRYEQLRAGLDDLVDQRFQQGFRRARAVTDQSRAPGAQVE
jgi:molybdate transport system regulatory protein